MKNEYVSRHSKPEVGRENRAPAGNRETANRRLPESYGRGDAPVRREQSERDYSRRAPAARESSGGDYERRESQRREPPRWQPPHGRKRSAGVLIVLILLIIAAAAVLVYLAANVFHIINIPFLSQKAAEAPAAVETAVPETTVESVPEPASEPTPEPAATPEPDYVYTAAYKTLDNGGNYVDASPYSSDGFYTASWKIADDGYSYVYEIYNIGSDGTMKRLDSYQTMSGAANTAGWNNFFSSADLTAVTVDAAGSPVVLESVSSSGELTTGETVETMFETKLYVRTLTSTGGEASAVELVSGSGDGITARGIRVDASGNYVVLTDTGAAVFGKDGAMIANLSTGDYAGGILKLSNGRAAVVFWDDAGQNVTAVSSDGTYFAESWPVPDSAFTFADGAGKYLFYYSDGVELYGYDREKDEAVRILNWSESDISGVRVTNIASPDGENYLCVTNRLTGDTNSPGGYESALVSLTRNVRAENAQTNTLTLVSVNPVEDLQDAVADFNRGGSGARIVLKTFEPGDTEEETLSLLRQFVSEELDGEMPDLIDMTGMPYEQMAASGMLEDLYPYLDSDSELGRSSIFPQILSALEYNGGLYTTCSGFSLSTVIGPENVLGARESWTFDDCSNVTGTMGSGVSLFDGYTTRSTVLYEEMGLNCGAFVDWENGTCSFNSENFRKLLQFVKSVPAEVAENAEEISVANGSQFLERAVLFSYNDIILAASDFDRNETYIGLPVAEGYGTGMNLYKDFAMTSSCADKQAAWQFMRTYFTAEYQSGDSFWYFPGNVSAFNAGLEAAKKVQTDASGEKILRASLYAEDQDPQYFYQITDSQASTLKNLAENATPSVCSEKIYDLVQENAAGYLTGSDTVDAAAEAVQTAVSAYLATLK